MNPYFRSCWTLVLLLACSLNLQVLRAAPSPEQFAISVGTTVSHDVPGVGAGRLEEPGARDLYTFNGIAGQRLYFDELTGNGCIGSLRWKLRDAQGQLLFDQRFAAIEVCGSGPDAGLLTLPSSGTYSLEVQALDDWVEEYSFRVVPVADHAQEILLGDTLSRTLSTPGATDTYSFTGTAGQQLYFDELTGVGCTGSLRWKLLDPQGQILFDQRFAAVENCGSGPDAGLITLPISGNYSLAIHALNDWVEAYSFRVVPVSDHAQDIALGDTITHTLSTPGATDTYSFAGTAGQRLYFDELTGVGCTGSLRWKLLDPQGQILFDQRFAAVENCGSGPDAGLITLPTSGNYSLAIDALNDWVEAYSFRVAPVTDHAQDIALGDTLTRTLATPGATDTYSFTAEAGDHVYFDELTGVGCTGSLRWRLLDPLGQLLFDQRFAAVENCGSGPDAGLITLPASGTYSLAVHALNDWVEAYSFRIVPVTDHAQKIVLGDTLTHTLATPGATDTYSFAAEAGDSVYFDELTGVGCTGSLRWRLLGPQGQLLFDQRFAAVENCGSGPDAGRLALPTSGTYFLAVYALNDWVESYSFRVVPIADRTEAIALGDTRNHVLATPGATNIYSFAGAAGDRVYFDELTGVGCTGSLRWSLLGPQGQLLFDQRFAAVENCGSGPDAGLVTLPTSGSYSLAVHAINDWVEAYGFTLWKIEPPRVVVPADRVVNAGESVALSIDARSSSPHGVPLHFELVTAPSGSRLDTNTGSFTWTAPDDAQGDIPVELRVRDALGVETPVAFKIRVLLAPDLVTSRLQAATAGETGSPQTLTYRESNVGSRPAVGPWTTRVWLSSDGTQDASETLVGEFQFVGTLQPGQSSERSLQFRLPAQSGSFRLIAEADAIHQVVEADEDNNRRVSEPITVETAYHATVQADTQTTLAGTPVILRGEAIRHAGGPAVFQPVQVRIKAHQTTRVLTALTDATGHFSLTFRPLPTEAGHYTIGAAHPGEPDAPVQDAFDLLSLSFEPRELNARLAARSSTHLVANLVNPSALPLTGLVVSTDNLPLGIAIQSTVPSLIAANANVPVNLTVSAAGGEGFSGPVTVDVTSAEGTRAKVVIQVTVAPDGPRLVTDPSVLSAAMVRTNQTIINVVLRNDGTAASGPVNLLLPAIPWLTVANELPLSPISPGDSQSISLLLQPGADLPLGEHQGTMVITGAAAPLNLPFRFQAVSEATAGLMVEVVDEYTYYAAGAPRVGAATVIIRDADSTTERARALTGADGRVTFASLREGPYDLEVSADHHSTFRARILVQSGTVNEVQPFLTRETVRYEFTVVPATVEDRTRIRIETVFETFVPLPVITIEPNQIDVTDLQSDRTEIELKITNHGLIAAQGFQLNFTGNARWRLTPLIRDLGDLAARSSLTVPLLIERLDPPPAAAAAEAATAQSPASAIAETAQRKSIGVAGGGGDLCSLGGGGCYTLICGTNVNSYCIPVFFPYPCGYIGEGGFYLPPRGSGDGPGSYTPPISQAVPFNCDPCAGPLAQALFECVVGLLPVPDFAGCLKDAKGLGDALGDCYKAGLTNGPPCDMAGGGVALGSYTVSCLKALGKEVPYVGEILSGIDCYLKISKAQDDCKPKPGGSAASRRRGGIQPAGDIVSFYPGTLAVIEQGRRLEAIAGVFTALFGDPAWLHPHQGTNLNLFIDRFAGTIGPDSADGSRVTPTERSALLAGPLPDLVSPTQVETFLNRWNRTLDYANRRIFLSSEVPAGESTDFLALDTFQRALDGAASAIAANEADGFTGDPLAGLRFALAALRENLSGGGDGVCARVRLRLDQDAVVTRAAFNASLELENASDEPLTAVKVELVVTDVNGQIATPLFGVLPPELSNLNAVDGSGVVATQSTGRASWLLVPGLAAAPSPDPVTYLVGGRFSYVQGASRVSVPLTPAPITVHPVPRLALTYFHERDVRADDPFTDAIEPSIPYSLAVMARNTGFGTARNVRIISGEPKIIENEKGLLIDFKLLGTEVAGRDMSPSLTADFGDIDPGGLQIGRWLFTSTLQGQFISYSATFKNTGPLREFPELATVQDATIHELIHIVRAARAGSPDDGLPDFLVNDVPDDLFRPDTLYLSDGSTKAVAGVTDATFDGAPSAADLEVVVTAGARSGWTYFQLPDPGAGQFRLIRVLRADGSEVPLGDNAWTTDRTFIAGGRRPRYEHRLHLFDDTTGGPVSFRVIYESAKTQDLSPPVSRVDALPGSSPREISVQWSGTDSGGTGIAHFDIQVSVDGGPFTSWLEQTSRTGALFAGETGRRYAFLARATDRAGNAEALRDTGDTETVVNRTNTVPTLQLPDRIQITEGESVAFRAFATDADVPADRLTFALGAGAPPGVQLDSLTGRLRWVTGEGNGPSTVSITIAVTDNGIPPLQATGQMTVVVAESNESPILAPPENPVIQENQLLELSLSASDPDLPRNPLTWNLGPNSPDGASLDPLTGIFRWQPTELQGPSTNRIDVRVSDGMAMATAQFIVTVLNTAPDFAVSVGQTELAAGEDGTVPIRLEAGLNLTDFGFNLSADAQRLTGFTLQALDPSIGAVSLSPLGPDVHAIQIAALPGRTLPPGVTLARLNFESIAGDSTVVPLTLSDLRGHRLIGDSLNSPQALDGRVILRGPQPILEMDPVTGNLTLRGNLGDTLRVEHQAILAPGSAWIPLLDIPLTDTLLTLDRSQLNVEAGFFRATLLSE